jgi:predicted permease
MDRIRRAWARLVGFVGRRPGESTLDEELRFHLDSLASDLERRGLSREEAGRQARMRLDPEGTREAWRDERSLPPAEALLLDLRHAARGLRRDPLFTIAAVLTLALGIAAATVVASLVRGVLLRPLPYPEPERLVRVFQSSSHFPRFPFSPLDFADTEQRARSLSGFGGWLREDLELSGGGPPARLRALRVTPGYFRALGVSPQMGRLFTEGETLGEPRTVILSDRTWRERFSAAPDIVGRRIRLDRQDFTVVGVLPAGFEHVGGDYRSLPQGETVDAWWPLPLDPSMVQRSWHYVNTVARLAPGVDLKQASADLGRVAAELGREHPESAGWRPLLVPLREELVGGTTSALALLSGAVALLLVIACANVAGLILARATGRRRELAVRHALGAGRSRLVGLGLAEALLLSVLGGALGVGLAQALLPALLRAMPGDFPRLHAVSVDESILAFAVLLCGAATLLVGLAPALQNSSGDLQGPLRGDSAGGTASRRALRWRGAIVVVQMTLACALLAAASLLLRSFETLLHTPPGFEPRGALAFDLYFPPARYSDPAALNAATARLEERLRALPGVRAAGLATALPWTGWDENTGFEIVGREVKDGDEPNARFGSASPGFFGALGLPVRSGRGITAQDAKDAPPVVVVNAALARKYFVGQDPVGRSLDLWGSKRTIVGVVGDVKDAPADLEAQPAFYWPTAQQAFPALAVVVRADHPLALLGSVRSAVAEVDPELPVANLRPLEEVADAAYARRLFLLAVVVIFAGLALALAAVGAYGTLAYAVERRRREIGIRVALGADRRLILRQVVGQGLGLSALGIGLGLAVALVAGRLLQSLLYGVTPHDPSALAAASAILLLVSALAALLPALKALRSSPARVLRAE